MSLRTGVELIHGSLAKGSLGIFCVGTWNGQSHKIEKDLGRGRHIRSCFWSFLLLSSSYVSTKSVITRTHFSLRTCVSSVSVSVAHDGTSYWLNPRVFEFFISDDFAARASVLEFFRSQAKTKKSFFFCCARGQKKKKTKSGNTSASEVSDYLV